MTFSREKLLESIMKDEKESNSLHSLINGLIDDCAKDAEEGLLKELRRFNEALESIAAKLKDDEEEEQFERCPICGSSAHAEQDVDGMWYVSCNYCPLETAAVFESKEEAMDFWNERV